MAMSDLPRAAPTTAVTESRGPRLEDLIERTARGDVDALGALFAMHAPLVHRTALRLTLSPDEADDIVQEVFIGLPRALTRYSERGTFDAWLRMLAVRVSLMRLRMARTHQQLWQGPSDTRATADEGQRYVQRASIAEALARLPEDQRLVFTLKVVEGYTHDEIARELGVTRNTSEVRLFRAIRRLRAILESDA